MERIGGKKLAKLLKDLNIAHPQSTKEWDLVNEYLSDLPQINPNDEADVEMQSWGKCPDDEDSVEIQSVVSKKPFRRVINPGDHKGAHAETASQSRVVRFLVGLKRRTGNIVYAETQDGLGQGICPQDCEKLSWDEFNEKYDPAQEGKTSITNFLKRRKSSDSIKQKR